MSYIHCTDGNYYTPSENLRGLFENLVVQPFENHPHTPHWEYHVKNRPSGYHRQRILDRGVTDFREGFEGLSPEDKVLIYCVHYMPMHLFSSYHIFTNHLSPISDKVVFIDFGCGPLTSGIAFWAATRHHNITYIGIDNSIAMLNMAKEINQYGPDGYSGAPFYENVHLITDYNEDLLELLASIEIGNPTDTLLIFNFCYFLQSKTFNDPSNIERLGELLVDGAFAYGDKTCMIYQDPVGDGFQDRWYNLKSWVITSSSMFNVSGFTWQDPTEVVHVKYDRLRQGTPHDFYVSYDSFNNFYYFDNYTNR